MMRNPVIGAIVQARMSSRRFPGKVLHEVGGRPLLGYLLDRLKACAGLATIIVATSTEESDDPVARFCANEGISCVRGPLEDVAGRFVKVLEGMALDGFLRVCGDSPWLDPALVEKGLRIFREDGPDLATNVFPRSFPPGQSVEVVRTGAFREAYDAMTGPEEREHVTKHFYNHPEGYAIRNFSAPKEYGDLTLALDTKADMAAFEAAVSALARPQREYNLDETAGLYRDLFAKDDKP